MSFFFFNNLHSTCVLLGQQDGCRSIQEVGPEGPEGRGANPKKTDLSWLVPGEGTGDQIDPFPGPTVLKRSQVVFPSKECSRGDSVSSIL